MEDTTILYRFGAALFIGLLIGLQREVAYSGRPKAQDRLFAGERTLALMSLVGCTAAMIADQLNSALPFVAIVLLMGAWITVSYFVSAWRGNMGMTTEVAALLTVLAGALCYWDQLALAAALAVATTVILSLKLEMDRLVEQITGEDVTATLKFAVITAIILPVLPDTPIGPPPLDVLNPRTIWLMVVLISGINFLGYLLFKVVGTRQGIGLTGLLGGLASSTAVTLSFTQRSKLEPALGKSFALAIIAAWMVMFGRILVVVAILNKALLPLIWLPISAAGLVGLAYAAYLYFSQHPEEEGQFEISNPFELWPAVKFGLIYAVILLISRAGEYYLGNTGVLFSSVFTGLADVDAITISVSQLSNAPAGLALATAATAIVLAAMANTVAKGTIVLTGGSRSLRRAMLPGLLLILAAGIGLAFLI